MTRRNDGDAGGDPGAAAATSHCQAPDQHHQASAQPAQRVHTFGPDIQRATTVWIVEPCPWCGNAHVHRGPAEGGERRAHCGRGRYEVGPT